VVIPVAEDTVLGGRYRLGPLLGAGGMAEVYDGRDERLDRPVAVKLLRPDLAAHAGLRQRFELEARAAARLAHPNVVAVYDAGEDQGHSYIVMERLRGESLADVIGRGPVDLAWLRRLAGEVLSALAAAHQAGIIHRDIKPANILLGPDGRGKVADFGIARVAEAQIETEPAAALTGTGLVLGTPAYLAPERAMGEPATPQSDLYSVGVVLYEAVTGSKPYGGRTPVAIAAAAVSGAAENPVRLRPDADAQLVAVIAKAMAVDPAQRYATAAAMAADLRREAPPATAVMPAGPGLGAVGAAGGDVGGDAAAAAAVGGVAGAAGAAAATVPLGSGAPGATVPLPPSPPRAPGPLPASPLPPAMRPGPPRPRRRRRLPPAPALAALGAVAIAAVVVALIVSNSGTGSPAKATTGSTTATTAAPRTTTTAAPPPTTASTVVTPQSDPIATALAFIADRLANSSSAAAAQLAAGLKSVAATDPASRAGPATTLLNQAVKWFQDGKLSATDYAAAAALLHQAGAPQAPPPTVKKKGNSGDGGGG
jgi:non-specific serine/threonine protein kinase/serine/threonine-protein kinase